MSASGAEPVPIDGATFKALASIAAETARRAAAPRLTVSPDEAAAMLGVSRDTFDRHVKPDLRVIRHGRPGQKGGRRLVLVPVRELERWVEENACGLLD